MANTLKLYKGIHPVKTVQGILALSIFFYVLLIGFFTYNFNLPGAVLYVSDILDLVLLLTCVRKLPKGLSFRRTRWFYLVLLALFLEGTVSALCHGFHILLWAWALRNWGRMFLYFLLCVIALDRNAVELILKTLEYLYHVNVVVILIQFFFFSSHYTMDSLNGLVGRDVSGANIVLSLMVLCAALSRYFTGAFSWWKFLVTVLEINVTAALAEIKGIIYLEPALLLLYFLINLYPENFYKGRWRELILVLLASMALIYLGSYSLGKIYSYTHMPTVATAGGAIQMGVSGGYDEFAGLDRLTAIPVLNKVLMNDRGLAAKLFGIGIGNGEYSSFSALTSAVYQKIGEQYRYLFFSYADLYLETGWVGVVLYAAAFLVVGVSCSVRIVRGRKQNFSSAVYENVGFGAAVVSLVMMVYNNLQRTDLSFLLGLFLSVPAAVSFHKREDVL